MSAERKFPNEEPAVRQMFTALVHEGFTKHQALDWLTKPNPSPFPYLIGSWSGEVLLDAVLREFPTPSDQRWVRFDNEHELKFGSLPEMWGTKTRELLVQISDMAPILSELFDIPDLSMETVGGGMHLIPPGGKLNIHVDFNRSPDSGLYRRLNCLVFLNRNWQDEGGFLELWPDGDGEPVRIAPEFNRTVIFETSDRSWHGHPMPANRYRASVAAYFYSPEPPPGYREDHSTVWRQP